MTIPKNSKRANTILAGARNIKVYSLSNSFIGEALTDAPTVWAQEAPKQLISVTPAEYLAYQLHAGFRTKLSENSGEYARVHGRYTIQVHSNLWYDFDSEY